MLYPEKIVCNELKWEYGLSKWGALLIINHYKQIGQYPKLCQLIEKRGAMRREVI